MLQVHVILSLWENCAMFLFLIFYNLLRFIFFFFYSFLIPHTSHFCRYSILKVNRTKTIPYHVIASRSRQLNQPPIGRLHEVLVVAQVWSSWGGWGDQLFISSTCLFGQFWLPGEKCWVYFGCLWGNVRFVLVICGECRFCLPGVDVSCLMFVLVIFCLF